MPHSQTILTLFNNQVKNKPQQPALQFKQKTLTYQELDALSNRLANYLVLKKVMPNHLIPICLINPVDMVVGILGILKAGAAFVPIDPQFPAERIKYIIEDTSARVVISNNYIKQFLTETNVATFISGDDDWFSIKEESDAQTGITVKEEDLAYVIYTSGSTGLPKGAMIKHQSLSNYLNGSFNRLPYAECKSYALGTTFAADFVVAYLFSSLTRGSTLHLFTKDDYRDVPYMHHYFEENKIDCLNIVPSHWKSLSLNGNELLPKKILLFGGEALYTELIKDILPSNTREYIIVNEYGPTETTIAQLLHVVDDTLHYGNTIPIGKTFTGAEVYILNEQGEEIKGEGEGELYISGICVAKGYLNRPELTIERFIKNPFSNEPTHATMYRTGDLVRRLADGNIEFIGRIDDQVKIRGFRIELGEIENVLQTAPTVKQCVVLAKEGKNGDKRLIGYVISTDDYNKEAILRYLEEKLPDYMVPRLLVSLKEFPFLANGKVDKKALPNPDASTLLTHDFIAPTNPTEKLISKIWKELLVVERAGADDNFFELGGNSLLSLKFVSILKSQHQIDLPVVKLYQFPKIKDLAAFLDGKTSTKKRKRTISKQPNTDVAIIGMSGRFPGADSIEALWTLLKEGKETVSFFKDEELDKTIPDSVKNNPYYVKSRGIVKGVKEFDASFFGINPNHAKLMDPQQRIFLEIAWEALEQTGYANEHHEQTIGVFAGVNVNTYFINNVLSHPELIENSGNIQTTTFNDKDYVATRASYSFNLKGPAVNVQTACSTSLVAVAQAVQSIRNGQCDMALAGGASIHAPVHSGHLYEEGAMFSKDGHCRPFDADATGTSFSDGAGVVLLKNKEQALKDGDTIYGVIKGIGLSNDGGGKGSFMAPSAEGQANAISMAIEDAGIDAKDISYIEAHGTATPLGDPIEIEGLNMAFEEANAKQYCAIGSVKSNFGHLTIAAGVAGLIKTCLSIYHKKLLPSINYTKPNPHIDFENSPFFVNTTLQDWETDKKRIAGVSSFGVGGTNAHVIVEEHVNHFSRHNNTKPAQLICWSAKSDFSVNEYGKKLASFLEENKNIQLADIAYTLQLHRKNFNKRKFIVAEDLQDFIHKINEADAGNLHDFQSQPQQMVFMFPGQGDQYINMGKSLYETEKVFRAAMDECAGLLKNEMGENILDIIYPKAENEAAKEKIKQTRYSQPALFSIGYALGKLWMSWGIHPAAFIGHSIGEFVAAHFSGIFSLEDAVKLIAARGKMMYGLPEGSMLSVRLSEEEIQPYLSNEIELAAINSPQLCVVAGTTSAIAALSETLDKKEIVNRILATSHAFHSFMMDEVVVPFENLVKTVRLHPPQIPIVSTVTGEWLKEEDALLPKYWAEHLRKPVRYAKATQKLIENGYDVFLELGPGKSVATLTRQQAAGKKIAVISSIEKEETVLPSFHAILHALGKLWQHGISIDWERCYQDEYRRQLHHLPTYAFDKKLHWLEALPKQTSAAHFEGTPIADEKENTRDASLNNNSFIAQIKEVLEQASGISMKDIDPEMSLIAIGLDSLSITQVASLLKKKFKVPISFRQLNESLGTVRALSNYLEEQSPDLIHSATTVKKEAIAAASAEEQSANKKPFGAIARIEKNAAALTPVQQEFLNGFIKTYNQKTASSKNYTEKNRAQMADPRVVSGFKPTTKEIVYPIVVNKSKGCRLWDIDNNEYIDALNGFGSSMLGYQPDFLKKALIAQIEKGYEIGPQHELAGEVCQLICAFTNFERAALCNTGSEAVLGAIRIARTVTGKPLIVAFENSYHGINDEVIARSGHQHKTYPAAPGIMPEAVQNMLILEYGTEASLKIIEERIDEIAAVLVEPVQSRRCDFQPVAFLKKLRKITDTPDVVLIFDEIISGFRFHPGGVQAMFGVQADLATYGKVIGGGLSIGAIVGKKQYMDALDGGEWQYGDDSIPEVGVTYFAGTFVRHPLALATMKASLEHFKAKGIALQESLNRNGRYIADEMNKICKKLQVPIYIAQFCSIWRIQFFENCPHIELLYALMRLKGIHILEGFPCFVTTAHQQEDIQAIIDSFEASLHELKNIGLLPIYEHATVPHNNHINTPPVPNARLGKDKDGYPAWFIKDEKNQGKYLQVIF